MLTTALDPRGHTFCRPVVSEQCSAAACQVPLLATVATQDHAHHRRSSPTRRGSLAKFDSELESSLELGGVGDPGKIQFRPIGSWRGGHSELRQGRAHRCDQGTFAFPVDLIESIARPSRLFPSLLRNDVQRHVRPSFSQLARNIRCGFAHKIAGHPPQPLRSLTGLPHTSSSSTTTWSIIDLY